MQRLSAIVEMSQFYPFLIKKNKNFSQELYYVLSSGTSKDFTEGIQQIKQNKTKTAEELRTEQVVEFVWSKIEEKFSNLAKAFRFFDLDNNTQLTRKEFRDGLERLKIKITDEDRELVFNYLDNSQNGWLSYREFCHLVDEKRRKIDPFDYYQIEERVKSSNMTPETLMKQSSIFSDYNGYGVKTLPSDNIKDVINYEFSRQSESMQRKKQMSLQSYKSSHLSKPKHTKASKMRDSAIRQHQENLLSNKNIKPLYKLKQFLNVQSSEYIKSAKRRQKTVRENPYIKNDNSYELGHIVNNSLNYSSIKNMKHKNKHSRGYSNGINRKTVHGDFPHLRTKSIDAYSMNKYGLNIDNPTFDNGIRDNVNKSLIEPNLKNKDVSGLEMLNSKKKSIENLGRNKRFFQDDYGNFDQQNPQTITEIKKYQSLPRLDNKNRFENQQNMSGNAEILPEKDRKKLIAEYFEQKKSMETKSQYGSVR